MSSACSCLSVATGLTTVTVNPTGTTLTTSPVYITATASTVTTVTTLVTTTTTGMPAVQATPVFRIDAYDTGSGAGLGSLYLSTYDGFFSGNEYALGVSLKLPPGQFKLDAAGHLFSIDAAEYAYSSTGSTNIVVESASGAASDGDSAAILACSLGGGPTSIASTGTLSCTVPDEPAQAICETILSYFPTLGDGHSVCGMFHPVLLQYVVLSEE